MVVVVQVYDSDNGLMILFGGWANRWFGDICVCKVPTITITTSDTRTASITLTARRDMTPPPSASFPPAS